MASCPPQQRHRRSRCGKCGKERALRKLRWLGSTCCRWRDERGKLLASAFELRALPKHLEAGVTLEEPRNLAANFGWHLWVPLHLLWSFQREALQCVCCMRHAHRVNSWVATLFEPNPHALTSPLHCEHRDIKSASEITNPKWVANCAAQQSHRTTSIFWQIP